MIAISRPARHGAAWLRALLGALCGFAALNAFAGGEYALSGASGVPVEWLEGTPFRSYFVPGLILMFVVGGTQLAAAVMAFLGRARAPWFALGAAGVMLGWLAVQVAIIGPVSWMQPATAVAAGVEIALAGVLLRARVG